jgi:hypothetical protein
MKGSQPFWKYLIPREGRQTLHIVARKGGQVVYTLCGETFQRLGSRTLTQVPKTYHVCTNCAEVVR